MGPSYHKTIMLKKCHAISQIQQLVTLLIVQVSLASISQAQIQG